MIEFAKESRWLLHGLHRMLALGWFSDSRRGYSQAQSVSRFDEGRFHFLLKELFPRQGERREQQPAKHPVLRQQRRLCLLEDGLKIQHFLMEYSEVLEMKCLPWPRRCLGMTPLTRTCKMPVTHIAPLSGSRSWSKILHSTHKERVLMHQKENEATYKAEWSRANLLPDATRCHGDPNHLPIIEHRVSCIRCGFWDWEASKCTNQYLKMIPLGCPPKFHWA